MVGKFEDPLLVHHKEVEPLDEETETLEKEIDGQDDNDKKLKGSKKYRGEFHISSKSHVRIISMQLYAIIKKEQFLALHMVIEQDRGKFGAVFRKRYQ